MCGARQLAGPAADAPRTPLATATVLSFCGTPTKGSVEGSDYHTPVPGSKRHSEDTDSRIYGARDKLKRRAVPDKEAATSVVSLVGLDPLDDIDMNDPSSHAPSFYKMRLGKDDDDVPVTFADKRTEVHWTGIFGQAVADQLFSKRTHAEVSGGTRGCLGDSFAAQAGSCSMKIHYGDSVDRHRSLQHRIW
jgi:hypothetical protein